MSDEERIEEEWVCTGHYCAGDGKEYARFSPLVDGQYDIDAKELMYPWKSVFPGSVYKVKTNAKRDTCTKPKFVRAWPYEDDIMAWEANSKVAHAEAELALNERRAKRNDSIYKCLRPLGYAYATANSRGRRVIELTVLETLNKYAMEAREEAWNRRKR